MSAPESQAALDQDNHYLHELVGATGAMLALSTLFVGLRLISRFVSKPSQFAWDDGMVIAGYISNLAFCIAIFWTTHETFKLDVTHLAPEDAMNYIVLLRKGVYVAQITYIPAFTFPKLSICALYLRIFTSKVTRGITWLVIGIMCALCISFFIGYICICIPPASFWDETIDGSCFDNTAFDRAVNGPNIVTDIVLLILPLPTVWTLKTTVGKKIGITITFLTGSIGLIASCVRWAIFLQANIQSGGTKDQVDLQIWSVVETTMYLVASCLPPLRGLVSRVNSKLIQDGISSIFGSHNNSEKGVDLETMDDPKRRSFTKMRDVEDFSGSNSDSVTTTTANGGTGPRGSAISDEIDKDLERMAQLDRNAVHISRSVDVTSSKATEG